MTRSQLLSALEEQMKPLSISDEDRREVLMRLRLTSTKVLERMYKSKAVQMAHELAKKRIAQMKAPT